MLESFPKDAPNREEVGDQECHEIEGDDDVESHIAAKIDEAKDKRQKGGDINGIQRSVVAP